MFYHIVFQNTKFFFLAIYKTAHINHPLSKVTSVNLGFQLDYRSIIREKFKSTYRWPHFLFIMR